MLPGFLREPEAEETPVQDVNVERIVSKPTTTLLHGDCLKLMFDIPDKSVDMVCCDMPYGTTACKWDTVLSLDMLWNHYLRIVKPNGAIVLFCSQPFTSALVMSGIKYFRYSWVWDKRFGANFGVAKKQPLKRHEDVCVFSVKPHKYYPQMVKRDKPIKIGKNSKNSSNRGMLCDNGMNNPEYDGKQYDLKYPESIQLFNVREDKERYHPTQKPIALVEYLVSTYTNKGDIVLDNCMGSGTTGAACKNLGRNFIGIELMQEYFDIAKERIRSC